MDALPRRGWRYFATRLNGDGTETLIDPDLPLEGVTIEDRLSGHGGMTATIDPVYTRLLGSDGRPILKEWSTAIYAENDGDIRAGAILASCPIDGPSLALDAVGFTGYAQDMPYTGEGYKGVRVDPLDVVRHIWSHIQSYPGGNIGLTWDSTKSDVTIGTELRQVQFDTQSGPVSFEAGPYKLNWYSNHDLASDIDGLAEETPFDYHERHFWEGDVVRHRVDIGYPRLGRRRDDLRFVHGVNVFEPVTSDRDGSIYASGTLVLGAGEGSAMVKALREPATRPEDRLRRIAVVVDDRIKSKTKAAQRGDVENQWRARLDDVESVVVQDHPNAPLGSAVVGDEIRLEGQGDWADADLWVRILGISYQPENGQVAQYTVARTDKLAS